MSGFFIFKKMIFEKNSNLFGKGYKILSDLIYSSNNAYKINDFIIRFETKKRHKQNEFKILIQLIKFIILISFKD